MLNSRRRNIGLNVCFLETLVVVQLGSDSHSCPLLVKVYIASRSLLSLNRKLVWTFFSFFHNWMNILCSQRVSEVRSPRTSSGLVFSNWKVEIILTDLATKQHFFVFLLLPQCVQGHHPSSLWSLVLSVLYNSAEWSEQRVESYTPQNSSRPFCQQWVRSIGSHTRPSRNAASTVLDSWCAALDHQLFLHFSTFSSSHHSGTSWSWFHLSTEPDSRTWENLFEMFPVKV